MHMSNRILSDKRKITITEKLPESIESSKFFSHRARMSGECYSRKDSNSRKIKQRPQIFINVSFREIGDSKLSGLHPFDNMAIIHWIKNRSKTERL